MKPALLRTVSFLTAVLYCASSIAQTGAGRTFTPAADTGIISNEGGCIVGSTPVYDANGYWYQGRIRTCDGGFIFQDITVGQYSARPGEVVVASLGRGHALESRWKGTPHSYYFRATPNKSYPLTFNDDKDFYHVTLDFPKSKYSWLNVARVMPFVPTKFYDFGVEEASGRRYIGYGGIKIMPSLAAAAYPLDDNSIIVLMDGIAFSAEHSMVALLAKPSGAGSKINRRLVEIVYFQKNEPQVNLRRAFIPQFDRSVVRQDEWASIASDPGAIWLASGSQQLKDQFGRYIAYAGAMLLVGAALAAIGAGNAAGTGGQGRIDAGSILRNQQDSNSQRPDRRSSDMQAPAINPFYGEPGWGSKTPTSK